MHLEVSADPGESPRADPILTFREDEKSGMQVVVHLENRDVAFSLADLKSAISAAEAEVRRESS
jgi:hypothetical protein